MYKHILVATDGSELSARAIVEAVKLAKCTGAKLTGFYAARQYMPPYYAEGAIVGPGAGAWYVPKEEYEAAVAKEAAGYLAVVTREAQKAGVAATISFESNDFPAQAILDTAKKSDCDCIVMASHGRHGVSGFLLGSETNKVLTHGTLPVLVVR